MVQQSLSCKAIQPGVRQMLGQRVEAYKTTSDKAQNGVPVFEGTLLQITAVTELSLAVVLTDEGDFLEVELHLIKAIQPKQKQSIK